MKRNWFIGVLFLLEINLCFGQTNTQINNATAFARLYGYVRFFHPSDEAASLDWDRFAVYGSKQVESCKNATELQAVLTTLFHPIAPTVQIYPANQPAGFNPALLTPPDMTGFKVVSWQHTGVQLKEKSGLYKSTRTNRLNTYFKISDNGFGSVTKSLDAAAYRNKEFVFRARVKMGNGTGTGHLWVRVDKVDKKVGFFDNMNKRPIRSGEWQNYEIKGIVNPDAEQILLGALLTSTGELWLDNLSLQVKTGDSWQEVYGNSFDDENPGQDPKSLKSGAIAYKYQVMPLTAPIKEKWISIKKEVQVPVGKPTLLFKEYAQVGEYVQKELGSGLRAIIPLALYGDKEQTYPAADKTKLSQLKKALAGFQAEDLTGEDLYVRLGNIAITWNIFQHFYPYFDVAQTNWSKDLETSIKDAYADKSAADFLKTLQKLTAKLKDGHVRVSASSVKGYYSPPITWEWIENQLVVTNVVETTIPLTTGDVVTSIDGENPKDYFGKVHQYISAATKGYLNYRAQTEALLGEEGSTLDVEIKKADNTTSAITLNRNWPVYKIFQALSQQDSIKQLSPGIMYINVGNTMMKTIDHAMPLLQQSKAIICDLRGYPKSNHYFIENLLVRDDTSSQWMQTPQIIYPDQEKRISYRKSKWGMRPRNPHLTAKIIYLIDGRAISYAESYMSFIEHYKLATIVGQPTAGTNGNVNPFTLPGGYNLQWTGMKVLKHDGTQHHGVGILPDVYVEKTIKGVRQNRDEFLEKALELAKEAK